MKRLCLVLIAATSLSAQPKNLKVLTDVPRDGIIPIMTVMANSLSGEARARALAGEGEKVKGKSGISAEPLSPLTFYLSPSGGDMKRLCLVLIVATSLSAQPKNLKVLTDVPRDGIIPIMTVMANSLSGEARARALAG